jgi:hypothetical protein
MITPLGAGAINGEMGRPQFLAAGGSHYGHGFFCLYNGLDMGAVGERRCGLAVPPFMPPLLILTMP